jgi:hypothetical protein
MPSAERMERLTVMLPPETIDQVGRWAATAGLKRGQFASVALMIGARVLARQVVPEEFLTVDVVSSIAKGMGVAPEDLQEAVRLGRVKLT